MNYEKEQVINFYERIWNQNDRSAIAEILNADFTFRGSLGFAISGYQGFIEYVEIIHDALGNYQCIIEELVTEPSKVFARMTFKGIHKGTFMGHEATGKEVRWSGAALFTFENEKILDLWVLGDLKALENQLHENET